MPVAISVQSVADGMSTAPPESVITSGVIVTSPLPVSSIVTAPPLPSVIVSGVTVMVAPVSAASSRYVQGPGASTPMTVTSTPRAVMVSGVMVMVGDSLP